MLVKKELERWLGNNQWRIKEFKYSLYLLKKSPTSLLGVVLVTGLILIAIFAPLITPFPDAVYAHMRLQPPSRTHILGTDELGRDIFSRIIHGSRVTLFIGFTVVSIALSIGVPLGLISGYMGGKVDEFILRVTDVFLSIPALLLAILILSTIGPNIYYMMAVIAVTMWPKYARLVRGSTLSIRQRPYIEAARAFSAGAKHIIFRHILPNCMSPIIVQASFDIGTAILWASALGFLGLGARPPTPEWGLMIGLGRTYMPTWWWCCTFPGIAIVLAVIGFNLLGDGFRDILDPRMRR